MKKLLLVLVVILLFTGCGKKVKEVKSLSDFNTAASNEALIVSDNMGSYTAPYIKEAMIASNEDLSIEMIKYESNDDASMVQEEQIKAFMTRKSTNAVIKKEKGENYYKYTMITNGYYLVSSRVDNTLIFTNTLVKNKEAVNRILAEMEY